MYIIVHVTALLCSSRKYPYPSSVHRGSLEILRGRGVPKGKISKGKYEARLNLQRVDLWSSNKKKKNSVGEARIFCGTVHKAEQVHCLLLTGSVSPRISLQVLTIPSPSHT